MHHILISTTNMYTETAVNLNGIKIFFASQLFASLLRKKCCDLADTSNITTGTYTQPQLIIYIDIKLFLYLYL